MSGIKGLEIKRKQKGATIRVKDEKYLEELKEKYPNATVIESKTGDFSKYFSVVKEELGKYYWLFIETRVMFPEDWENFDELKSLIFFKGKLNISASKNLSIKHLTFSYQNPFSSFSYTKQFYLAELKIQQNFLNTSKSLYYIKVKKY